MPRLDSKLESAGAEFFVLGSLLIEGIEAYRAYDNHPGYDLVAIAANKNMSARISVKSRWATDFDGGFIIKNFDCDFVVLVALNRGFRYQKAKSHSEVGAGKGEPRCYVFPATVAKAALYSKSKWGKAFLKLIDNPDQYKNNWSLIRDFLNGKK